MIDHLNPYLASTLIAERLHEVREPSYTRHATALRGRRTTRRRVRRWPVSG